MGKTRNKIGFLIGIVGALAVVFGAFGAHALKEMLPPDKLGIYQTGVSYHFYHVLAMLVSFVSVRPDNHKWATRSIFLFGFGILLFSGSLYLLSVRELIGLEYYQWLGPLTPIGGLLFIGGWLTLGISLSRNYRNEQQ